LTNFPQSYAINKWRSCNWNKITLIQSLILSLSSRVTLVVEESAVPGSHLSCHTLSCMCASVASVVSNPMDCVACRILYPWDSPGKNTGVVCQALLQGSFWIQGLNPSVFHLLHWRIRSLPLGSPH
jgi:hypothetical protein